jgi:hypothetical protein
MNTTGISSGWQRNYNEHVIRGEEDLNLLREYINKNPAGWLLDENYLENGFAKGRVQKPPLLPCITEYNVLI